MIKMNLIFKLLLFLTILYFSYSIDFLFLTLFLMFLVIFVSASLTQLFFFVPNVYSHVFRYFCFYFYHSIILFHLQLFISCFTLLFVVSHDSSYCFQFLMFLVIDFWFLMFLIINFQLLMFLVIIFQFLMFHIIVFQFIIFHIFIF